MNRFWPVITQVRPPSRTALVRKPAGFEPAPGSVSANDATTSPEAMPVQPARLLLVGAEADEHLAGDAVVGAEHRPQRQRGVAELHRHLDVLGDVQAEPAPLLRDRVAEEAHLLGLVADVVGHPVVGHDLQLAGHHGGADEVPRRVEDVPEVGYRRRRGLPCVVLLAGWVACCNKYHILCWIP